MRAPSSSEIMDSSSILVIFCNNIASSGISLKFEVALKSQIHITLNFQLKPTRGGGTILNPQVEEK